MADFISGFITAMAGGGARTNLMMVTMTNNAYAGFTDWTYMCKASNIPGSTITPIEVPYFGRNVKVAGESREFGPLTTTVVNDEGRAIYQGMLLWMADMNHPEKNLSKKNLYGSSGSGTRGNYCADIELKMFKKDGTDDQTWKFANCWPSNMSAIDLNWDSVNTIQEFTIDWQYDYYLHKQAKITSTD